ncbi:dynein heavy chain 17, axonemal-like [Polyodon spathula]|uniref:dynein heavy chain 17, axonemal-like n=1 Tax=Polyodon spathula TaxID=7913 RepID=UPI001B7EC7BB|nr:dynein heavy chain 17, axonemal-like [Polyodon spathula]
MVEAKEDKIKINKAHEFYRPAAERASLLYFIINDLSKINPMYQFSVKSCKQSHFALFSSVTVPQDQCVLCIVDIQWK